MTIAQASAVPFRLADETVEVCLITSIKSGKWGFPKGIIDPGETYIQTALKEAEEEAGLIGTIVGSPLGRYQYEKWATDLDVTVVLMHVQRCENDWPESKLRQRRWVDLDEMFALIAGRPPQHLLELAADRLRAIARGDAK